MSSFFDALGSLATDDPMELFWEKYGHLVETVAHDVVAGSHSIVQPLLSSALYDREDLIAECRYAVLRHVPWLWEKQWLQEDRNIKGYLYTVMRKWLIDLYRRYEIRKRGGVELPLAYYDSTHISPDEEHEPSSQELTIQEDYTYDILTRNEALKEMLSQLAARIIKLETIARRYIPMREYQKYIEWCFRQGMQAIEPKRRSRQEKQP